MRRKQVLLAIWLVVIFILSSQPASTSSGLSSPFVESLRGILPTFSISVLTFIVRKAAHILLFGVLGAITYSLAREYKLSTRLRIGLSMGFVTICAIADEIHQLIVPGRSGEIRDIAIDVIAGTAGVVLYFVAAKQKNY